MDLLFSRMKEQGIALENVIVRVAPSIVDPIHFCERTTARKCILERGESACFEFSAWLKESQGPAAELFLNGLFDWFVLNEKVVSPIWMDSSTGEECHRLEEYIGGAKKLAEMTGSRYVYWNPLTKGHTSVLRGTKLRVLQSSIPRSTSTRNAFRW